VGEVLLGRNAIGDAGAAAFARGCEARASAFTKLSLMANRLGDDAAAAFGRALGTRCALRSLNLSHNRIGRLGIEALTAGVRHNARLATLDVGINAPGDGVRGAARALAAAMAGGARRHAEFREVARLVLLANAAARPTIEPGAADNSSAADAPGGAALFARLPHALLLAVLEHARPAGFVVGDAPAAAPAVVPAVVAPAGGPDGAPGGTGGGAGAGGAAVASEPESPPATL
jgi:hypothetical protein